MAIPIAAWVVMGAMAGAMSSKGSGGGGVQTVVQQENLQTQAVNVSPIIAIGTKAPIEQDATQETTPTQTATATQQQPIAGPGGLAPYPNFPDSQTVDHIPDTESINPDLVKIGAVVAAAGTGAYFLLKPKKKARKIPKARRLS